MSENMKRPTPRSSLNAVVLRLVELLTDPNQEWAFNEYTARHVPTGSQIWITNMPVLDTNTYPVPTALRLRDKWRIWQAVKVAKSNWMLRKLEPQNVEVSDGER